MNRADKIRLKAQVAEEIAELVRTERETLKREELEARGAISALEKVSEQHISMQNSLEKQLDEKKITPEEYKVAKNHGANMLNATLKMVKIVDGIARGLKPQSEGIGRTLKVLDRYYRQRMKQADETEVLDAELEAEEPEMEEERQKRIAAREKRAEAATKEASPEKEAEVLKPPAKRKQRKQKEPLKEETPKKASCKHCGDVMEHATGGVNCSLCVSYKNKNGKLPPKEALESRRKPSANS